MDKDEKLPAGFRFHPTDEELITCYLVHKISDASFTGRAIGDVDLNKCEPWDLPGKAKMGEKEFYFFSMRDRKYPTGVRTNRATSTGYWKTTGKDKEVHDSDTSELVGMKKTLVFYRGRAPRGEKTNWVMHEYRMHSKSPAFRNTKQDEWVVCRVFQKSAGGKKYPSTNLQSSSRAVVNPICGSYNLDTTPQANNMIVNSLIHHQHPEVVMSNNFLLHANRNYMMTMTTPAEFQELNKAGGSSSSNMLNLQQLPFPQQLVNYGPAGGFTISGLNLNLGGGALQPLVGMQDHQHGYMGMDECGADLENYWSSYQMGN